MKRIMNFLKIHIRMSLDAVRLVKIKTDANFSCLMPTMVNAYGHKQPQLNVLKASNLSLIGTSIKASLMCAQLMTSSINLKKVKN